jgi:hypothetical protein
MNQTEKFSALLERSLLAVLTFAFVLAGCGGGGGSVVMPQVTTSSLVQVMEGASATSTELFFPVILSRPADGELKINYRTVDLDATGKKSCNDAGADYVTSTATLTIASGQSSGVIKLTVCGDDVFEPNEKLSMSITITTQDGVVGGETTLEGVIVNDDAGGLNDTGATACSDGVSLAGCQQVSHQNQDAQHGRDSNSLTNSDDDGYKGFSFSKIDSAGNILANDAPSWSCVRDNVTGLMWESRTNQANIGNWSDAKAYADVFGTWCGFSGWRLPKPQELASLINSSIPRSTNSTAVTDQIFFADQQKATYWSSRDTDAAGNATGVWAVDFEYGFVFSDNETTNKHVRLVNGTPTSPNYQTPISNTVRDLSTGLHWQQCADGLSGTGCASGSAKTYSWQAALSRVLAVNQAKFSGYNDWRLPNRNELASIVDHSTYNPALDVTVFIGFPKANGVTPNFWTSSPYAADASKAWSVGFKDGEVVFVNVANPRYILLVRGGQ